MTHSTEEILLYPLQVEVLEVNLRRQLLCVGVEGEISIGSQQNLLHVTDHAPTCPASTANDD